MPREILKLDVQRLIPWSLYDTYECYVYHDGHPKDEKNIDITVCLRGGEVKELCRRECGASRKIPDVRKFNSIQIIRNIKGELFYIVRAGEELIILSSKDELSIHERFSDVNYYEVCDDECNGVAKLKIQFSAHVLPVIYSVWDAQPDNQGTNENVEYKPAISVLKSKLIEAKYTYLSNKKVFEDINKLRLTASIIQDFITSIECLKPTIKFCNKKIVMQIKVKNPHLFPFKNVCVLLHNTGCDSISYTSKVFEHLPTLPFYKESESSEIKHNSKATIVTVIPISEFENTISCKIDFSVIISYEYQENKKCVKYCDTVSISPADIMGEEFDVLSSPGVDSRDIILAMMATTTKTSLCLRRTKSEGKRCLLNMIFKDHLNMFLYHHQCQEKFMAIHKHSPLHVLHGIMIIFSDVKVIYDINYNIDVYTRSPSQILDLIRLFYDTVPFNIILTPPNIVVTCNESNRPGFSATQTVEPLDHNYYYSAHSLSNLAQTTLCYLENCKEANETDVGINLLAKGRDELEKYRNEMLEETKKTLKLFVESKPYEESPDVICLDSQ